MLLLYTNPERLMLPSTKRSQYTSRPLVHYRLAAISLQRWTPRERNELLARLRAALWSIWRGHVVENRRASFFLPLRWQDAADTLQHNLHLSSCGELRCSRAARETSRGRVRSSVCALTHHLAACSHSAQPTARFKQRACFHNHTHTPLQTSVLTYQQSSSRSYLKSYQQNT